MADHFCLKWNNFHNSILSAFESLQSSEDLVDVTLMCEGRNVRAHKVILSACSPYFRSLFKETPCQHPIIILKDVLHCDLLAILQFMYQGEVLVTQAGLTSFLKTAELLQVSGLAGNTHVAEVPETPSEPALIVAPPPVHIPPVRPKSPSTSPTPANPPASDISLTKMVEKENVSTEEERLADEPMQSCSYPHDDIVIKTETEELDFQEMEFANVSQENVDELGPSTDGSILKRSLKSQGISLHPTNQYTMDVPVLGPQISTLTTPTQSAPSPKPDLKPACIPVPTLIKANADLLAKELAKRKARASPEAAGLLTKRHPPKTDAKKSKAECRADAPKAESASHSSQLGICPHCNKVYSNQSALKYHVRLVHSDMLNMFCCHLCPESFEYRDGYRAHMWDSHSVRN